MESIFPFVGQMHTIVRVFSTFLWAQLHQVSICLITAKHHRDIQTSQVQQAAHNGTMAPS